MIGFTPPVSRDEAKKLSKRELLEVAKPVMRAHDNSGGGLMLHQREKIDQERWNWLWAVLEVDRPSKLVGQARHEVECEDEHDHYWQPAYSSVTLIEDGWNKYLADVGFPRPFRLSDDRKRRSVQKKFRSRGAADRWVAKWEKRYEKWVLRLIEEGLYDDYTYER